MAGQPSRLEGKRRLRPGLRLIMLVLGLVFLAMPVSGVYLFRIYENELVRQTETELIAQGALVGAMFREALSARGGPNYGKQLVGVELQPDKGLSPISPRLDLSRDEILPRSLGFRVSPYEPDSLAQAAGADLENILKESTRTTLSSIYVLDYHGFVVAGSAGHGLSMADNIEVSEALNGRYFSVMRQRPAGRLPLASASRRAGFRVFCAVPVTSGGRLVGVVHLSRTPREIIQAFYHEGPNVTKAAILSVGLMGLVVIIISLMVINPVKRLAREAAEVAEGRSQGVEPSAPFIVANELAELRSVVAEMAEKLRHRSDYLKAFASGVSHEFKTPLTSIKGAVELLSEHGSSMSPETKGRFEGNILGDLERLERLVGRLLALARAEAQAEVFPGKDSQTELGELLSSLTDHYRQHAYNLEIEAAPPLSVNVSRDVLETVLRNLIDNSRDVGATASFVEFEADPLSQVVDIFICDNGPGIPEELKESIFEPFFTTRKNKGGTGLGLSLARTLLAPHKGELDLADSDSGAAFVITLNLARKNA